ncbi:flagellar hook-length control protein FliK [Photobacterium sp. TY1-4]|uniref:flagellar hook-length control protein FliK n=1 Tax=Photobacterium sp. TY1-4 TaxID=2899122 RepID=UPI0021C1594A|nr:flagellar hook-length control protein FliK [Photobacterium sp. TY1-4]UXI00578.1 flagellar hook-length control protein FliK [Photobacterium sp. TY1-4]
MFSSRIFSAEPTPSAAQAGGSKASPNGAEPKQDVDSVEKGRFAETFESATNPRDRQRPVALNVAEGKKAEGREAASGTAETEQATLGLAASDEVVAESSKSGQTAPEEQHLSAAAAQGDGVALDAALPVQSNSGESSQSEAGELIQPAHRQNNDDEGLDPSQKRQIMDDGEALLSRLAAAEKQLASPAAPAAPSAVLRTESANGKELPLSAAADVSGAAAAQSLSETEAAATAAFTAELNMAGGMGNVHEALPQGLTADKPGVTEATPQTQDSSELDLSELDPSEFDLAKLDPSQLAAMAQLNAEGIKAPGTPAAMVAEAESAESGGTNAQMLPRQQAAWLEAVAQKVKAAAGTESAEAQRRAAQSGPGTPQAVAEAVSGSLGTGTLSTGTLGAGTAGSGASIALQAGGSLPGLMSGSGEAASGDVAQAMMSQGITEALPTALAHGAMPHGAEGAEGRGLEAAPGITSVNQAQGMPPAPLRAEVAQAPLMLSKEQAGEQLAERVQVMVAKNLKHVDIRLDPPELGRLQIKLSLNQDQASVQFHVSNAQTRELVEQAMPRLRELMNQQGLQLAQSSVQQDSSRQQFAGQSGQQQQATSSQSGDGQGGGSQSGHAGSQSQQGDSDALEMYVSQPTDRVDYYA